jgi:head-tail adaptor
VPVGRSVLGKARHTAGVRNKSVTIQTKTGSQGDSGFPTDTWADLATVMMSREDRTGDERVMASMDSAFVETDWQMPYLAAMDPELVDVPATKRLSYKGRIYNIRAAVLLDRREAIELLTLVQVG